MCKIKVPQEDADKVLAVGHKVMYQGKEAVITGIRVWHDKGTNLGPPQRHKAVFDLQGKGWSTVNTGIEDIDLWHETPPLPMAENSCYLGYCSKKGVTYGGGWNESLEKGNCPICGNKLATDDKGLQRTK